jgi:hypothetical protein
LWIVEQFGKSLEKEVMTIMEGHQFESLSEILEDWSRRAKNGQYAHYEAALRYSKRHYALGIPIIILTAVAGTSVFATLERQIDLRIQILIGSIIVISAILSALQTFLRLSVTAEKHRFISAQFLSLRNAITELQALPVDSDAELKARFEILRHTLDRLEADAPIIDHDLWARAQDTMKSKSPFESKSYSDRQEPE